ncbi:hypothetical protein Poli38472_008454 [Pythium oligandrum]|uniref:C2 domain-containing protein n=1 Tax=Pythium oligandrum TaxID=41045 RepID=A0A8K1C3G4_PYTOL|nr:hypothetical protein Poli38472_008454 [Pythium oligandrum]|eukprot:TMW55806.1 hypothetical protein Poli38472_008454 [Pythium oligandrum]
MSAYHAIGVAPTSPVTSPRESTRESEYYYTLVFPNTKAEGQSTQRTRLRYTDAIRILRAVTTGGKEREKRVIEEFRAAWIAKFRSPPPVPQDSIGVVHFHELIRELIVQRFYAIPDLFMKTSVSEDQQYLLLSFRSSRTLLCATADRLRMKVAMMSEIDPGPSYWTADPSRSASESYQWSKPDAQEELYRMFLAGKISSDEAQLFDTDGDHEDAAQWSRRIHALRRFFDPEVAKVVASQPPSDTTYLPFRHRASLRYLYRQIDGGADATPFRVVDKIRLTKAIIDAEFDCDALVEQDLLTQHFCAHTHHTDGIDTSIDVLQAQWGNPFSPLRLYRQRLVPIFQLLFFQPILHVRNYFGEELALYFAYTSFSASALQIFSVLWLALVILQPLLWPSMSLAYKAVVFAVLSTAFMHAFVRKWTLQERDYATQWGVLSLDSRSEIEGPRPQFRGELAFSPITHRLEPSYSPQKRILQQFGSIAISCGVASGLLFGNYVLVTSAAFNSFALSSHSSLRIAHVTLALVAKLLGGLLAFLASHLTNWENHRTQYDHDVNLTLKYASLQTVNLFGTLWILTFIRPLQAVETQCDAKQLDLDCTHQAGHLLMTILVVELLAAAWELRVCIIDGVWGTLTPRGSESDRCQLLNRDALSTALDTERQMSTYEGVMFDYAQVVIPMGFVAWFGVLAPLGVLLAWSVAVLQIRVDAYRLCYRTQRPFPAQTKSIGSWMTYLRVLCLGSWVHNAAMTILFVNLPASSSSSTSSITGLRDFLLLRTVDGGDDRALTQRLSTESLVIGVSIAFACVAVLASLPDTTDRDRAKQLHHRDLRDHFLENKYLNNRDSLATQIWEGLPSGRVFLNGVHSYIVTGNKAEEDAAEELLDELVQLQLRDVELQKQIDSLRAQPVGVLFVELGSINILPVMDALTRAVDSFVRLQIKADVVKRGKEAKPLTTSVMKKNRSPQWTESFEFSLQSLEDHLHLRVYDWEQLGKNRRIGQANLSVADIVAITEPAVDEEDTQPKKPAAGGGDTEIEKAPVKAPIKIRMARFEVQIEMPEVLLSTMASDLVKHGHPKLSLRCGVRLDALGRCLYRQQKLQQKIQQLKRQETQFFHWES